MVGPDRAWRWLSLIGDRCVFLWRGLSADDGFSAGATMPEPDADEMRNTSQAKARLQRITKWGIEALKFFAYVLQTPDLPFESAELSFTRAHEPLDLKQAHDRRKAFPKNGVWPPPQVPIASEEEEELMDMDEYETTPAEEMNAGADGEGELDEENATEAPQVGPPTKPPRRFAVARPVRRRRMRAHDGGTLRASPVAHPRRCALADRQSGPPPAARTRLAMARRAGLLHRHGRGSP